MLKFKKLPFKKEQVWVTSDLHGFHKNFTKGVSEWSDKSKTRDFEDEIQMTEHIITNLNSIIKEDDLLIHHGDFSFSGEDKIKILRNKINCKNIIGIEGNHDFHTEELKSVFTEFVQIGYYQIENLKFVCCHYPIAIWHQSHKNIPLFFGHVHGSFPGIGKSLDVGIDNYYNMFGEYKPFSLQQAYNIAISKQSFLESHHNINTNKKTCIK